MWTEKELLAQLKSPQIHKVDGEDYFKCQVTELLSQTRCGIPKSALRYDQSKVQKSDSTTYCGVFGDANRAAAWVHEHKENIPKDVQDRVNKELVRLAGNVPDLVRSPPAHFLKTKGGAMTADEWMKKYKGPQYFGVVEEASARANKQKEPKEKKEKAAPAPAKAPESTEGPQPQIKGGKGGSCGIVRGKNQQVPAQGGAWNTLAKMVTSHLDRYEVPPNSFFGTWSLTPNKENNKHYDMELRSAYGEVYSKVEDVEVKNPRKRFASQVEAQAPVNGVDIAELVKRVSSEIHKKEKKPRAPKEPKNKEPAAMEVDIDKD